MNKFIKTIIIISGSWLFFSTTAYAELPTLSTIGNETNIGRGGADLHINFLQPKGGAWHIEGTKASSSNLANNSSNIVVGNKAIPAFMSSHYYLPSGVDWHQGNAYEQEKYHLQMFERSSLAATPRNIKYISHSRKSHSVVTNYNKYDVQDASFVNIHF